MIARIAPRLVALALVLTGCQRDEAPCGGAGVICSIAGTGEAGFNGDGQPGAATSFYFVSRVRPGPEGLVYVMDSNNMRLRRVRPDGTIETVLGSGEHSLALEGGGALDTPLENPFDFVFDDQDRIVFVSLHDPRVIRVEEGGRLSVLAGDGELGDNGDGGAALMARFTQLNGIALGADGTIFVSDSEMNRVRAVTPDGAVVAHAGSGTQGYAGDGGPAAAAMLFHPQGLALDAQGNLYIADTFNHVIRRVDAETQIITTVAGTGEQGLSGDGGPAIDAELRLPMGVSVASDGAVFIADTLNHRIRRLDPDGTISAVAGTTEGLSGDGGPALSAQLRGPAEVFATDDALYVADTQNHAARVIYLK